MYFEWKGQNISLSSRKNFKDKFLRNLMKQATFEIEFYEIVYNN